MTARKLRKYKANVTVLGLHAGETFESNNSFYDIYVTKGYLTDITEEVDEDGDPGSETSGAEGSVDGSITEGGDQGSSGGGE